MVDLRESDDVVELLLEQPTFVGFSVATGVFCEIAVVLDTPLADRRIVDASE